MQKCKAGIIGLGVMGRNLARNMAEKGFPVAVHDYWPERIGESLEDLGGLPIFGAGSLETFTELLEKPRRILIMVKAGEAVDRVIESLKPLLDEGDILMDGGNSFFEDTRRRFADLKNRSVRFLGIGISGGEEGARNGPAIMPGGDPEAYAAVESILSRIAAHVEGEPCCRYMGDDGAGHFVKMVHNGIEYADMQLICEAYHLLRTLAGLDEKELHRVFSDWNRGELGSYLIEITADILSKYDPETGKPVVDIILDKAGQKGTGIWTSQTALTMGIAVPTITEAVFARSLSSIPDERKKANPLFQNPPRYNAENRFEFIEKVREALYASKICSYAQGFSLIAAAGGYYGWNLNPGDIAAVFRGGCIIRAQFLNRIRQAYADNPALSNLLTDPYFKGVVNRYQPAWRDAVATAVLNGIPIPAFSSALSYFDAYRSNRLPANLLQAQRDYFGAHTFERTDKEGSFHFNWQQEHR